MVSEKKIQANRNNARASTGPRTASGKTKASRNAKKHGLSLSVQVDSSIFAQLYELGKQITGANAPAELIEPACRIVAAQLDLVRIRKIRNVLFSEAAEILSKESPEVARAKPLPTINEIVARLTPLDRYERRALSRRKRAVSEFDVIKRRLN